MNRIGLGRRDPATGEAGLVAHDGGNEARPGQLTNGPGRAGNEPDLFRVVRIADGRHRRAVAVEEKSDRHAAILRPVIRPRISVVLRPGIRGRYSIRPPLLRTVSASGTGRP